MGLAEELLNHSLVRRLLGDDMSKDSPNEGVAQVKLLDRFSVYTHADNTTLKITNIKRKPVIEGRWI